MKRVFICSPLSGDFEANQEVARKLMHAALMEGVAPFVPHLLYTQVLEDTDPNSRIIAMACGMQYLHHSNELWVYTKNGISPGMKAEIKEAQDWVTPVVYDPLCWEGI